MKKQQHGLLERLAVRIFWPVLQKFISDDDDEEARKMKLAMVPMVLVYVVLHTTYALVSLSRGFWYLLVGPSCLSVFGISYLTYVYVTKRSPHYYSEFMLMLGMTVTLAADAQTRGSYDLWMSCVLVWDVCLLGSFRPFIGVLVRNITLVYLFAKSLEEVYRFGLYDIPSETAMEPRPRVELATGLQALVLRGMLFICDYGITRHFSDSMNRRQQEMKESVQLAEQVAQSFVKFDLSKAERLLDSYCEAGNDNELIVPFRELLTNLQHYRPYLPQHLMHHDNSSCGSVGEGETMLALAAVSAACAPRGRAAIVFTDIQSSTSLWEAVPQAMRPALTFHNKVMRTAIAASGGYEVKTIGDAFMVAFGRAGDAVTFCLQAQEALVAHKYAPELTAFPDCAQVGSEGSYLWNGLRVRMGVHVGEVDAEQNPITGRYDYFGNTVNIAARVEGSSIGGAIAVTSEVLRGMGRLATPHIIEPMGDVVMKGMQHPTKLYLLFPSKLGDRFSEIKPRWNKQNTGIALSSSIKHRRLRSSPEVAPVTVACIYIKYVLTLEEAHEKANSLVCSLLEALERTQGTVSSVTGLGVTAMWNVGRTCPQHTPMAMRFANIAQAQLAGGVTETHGHVGIAAGRVLHGSVGTDRTKFMIAIGSCVNVADALSRAGAEAGAFALLGEERAVRVTDDALVRRETRLLDVWGYGASEILVYEVRPEVEALWSHDEAIWNNEVYKILVLGAVGGDAGSTASLRRLADPTDEALARLISRAERGKHLVVKIPSLSNVREAGNPLRHLPGTSDATLD